MTKQALINDVSDIMLTSPGPDNALTVKEIAYILDIGLEHETGPNIREAIRQLILEGHPIGSCNRGYFYIDSFEDLRGCLSGLTDRINSIEKRKTDMINAYVKSRRCAQQNMRKRCTDLVHDIAESYKMHYSSVYMFAYRLLEKEVGYTFIDTGEFTFATIISRVEEAGELGRFYDILVTVEDMLI